MASAAVAAPAEHAALPLDPLSPRHQVCQPHFVLFSFLKSITFNNRSILYIIIIAECILNIGGGVFATHLKLTDTSAPYTVTVWGSQHCTLRLLVMGGGGAGHYGGGGSGFIRGSS